MKQYTNKFRYVPYGFKFKYDGQEYEKISYWEALYVGTTHRKTFSANDMVIREVSGGGEPVTIPGFDPMER